MKCPKCGYLGFEHVERCRNCGYDFSLAPALNLPELPMRSGDDAEVSSPPDDLALVDAAALAPRPPWQATPDLARVIAPRIAQGRPVLPQAQDTLRPSKGEDARGAPSSGQGPSQALNELPLFGPLPTDELPLITKPSPPRAPLAVRRATPEVPRVRSEPLRAPLLDLSGPTPPTSTSGTTPQEWPVRSPVGQCPSGADADAAVVPATVGARVAAFAIDIAILAAIDAIVVYFTMEICGLAVRDLPILPRGPLIAFLLLQNGGYLVAFTVGGQTLGKMAAGIKIMSALGKGSPGVGHSLLRTIVWLLLAAPAGLGFVTALFNRDRRGLHDHCAGTRVVRAV